MPTHHLASWLLKRNDVPLSVVKPVASRLGVSTNYLAAALFAGQLVYENQETVVTYASKGGVTVGEFLHERSRQRYGEDHPLTEYLGENVDAITEAFEGTEAEARTFAEFYRQYRAVDRDHRLRDEVGLDVFERFADRLPGADRMPGTDRLPGTDELPNADAIPELGGSVHATADADDAVEIPVIDRTD